MSKRLDNLWRGLSRRFFGSPAKPRLLRRRARLWLEPLEDRVVPTVDLTPTWVEQGPGPIDSDGNFSVVPFNFEAGAVNAVAPHPTDPNILYAATVNGGIWRTDTALTTFPIWTPLTDQLPSLSIGDIAFDPLDQTHNTLVASIGDFSSGGAAGGRLTGALRTTDGGQTWTQLQDSIVGQNVRDIAARGNVIIASTEYGLWYSDDFGATWDKRQQVWGTVDGQPKTAFTRLAEDITDPTRFYAAIGNQGIYRSDNQGQTWQFVTGNIPDIEQYDRIRVSVGAGGYVYAALMANKDSVPQGFPTEAFWWSPNQGTAWFFMDRPTTVEDGEVVGLNAGRRFSFVADPVNTGIVYVGGNAQPKPSLNGFPNSIGADDPSGRLFTGTIAGQWSPITHDYANKTAPHPDSRNLAFDAAGDLLDTDDGGVFRLVFPGTSDEFWESVDGTLRVTEFYSATHDPVTGITFGGTQDNDTVRQYAPGFIAWSGILIGDGGVVAVDNQTVPGDSIHYYTAQNFIGFRRETLKPDTTSLGTTSIGLHVIEALGQDLRDIDDTVQFINPYVLNAVNHQQMLIGTSYLYESLNQGDSLARIGGYQPLYVGPVTALAYGGRKNGADNVDVAWVGSKYDADPDNVVGQLWLRTTAGGNFDVVAAYSAMTGAGTPTDIVLDPEDWGTAYVTDSDQVFMTTDGGATFTDITGNLAGPSGLTTALRPVALIPGSHALLVGGIDGVYVTLDPAAGVWTKLGVNLPNVVVRDLEYDPVDHVLVVATFGRGVWTIPDVENALDHLGTVRIDGDTDYAGEDDDIRLVVDAENPAVLDIFVNNSTLIPTAAVPLSFIRRLEINGLGGEDDITLDFRNGDFTPSMGLDVQGGADADQLTIFGPAGDHFYRVAPAQVLIDGQGGGTFGEVERLKVFSRDGAHIFDVLGIDAGTRVSLYGGPGKDTFHVDSNGSQTAAGVVKTIGGELDIDGGPDGNNSLTLNDVSDAVASQMTVAFNYVGAGSGDNFFGPGGRLYYEALSSLTIDMGAGVRDRDEGNLVYVLSTAAGTPVYINSGQNTDTVIVGAGPPLGGGLIGGDGLVPGTGLIGGDGRTPGTDRTTNGDVSGIRSKLVIDGQDGADKLFVLDDLSGVAKQVTLSVTPPPKFNLWPDTTLGAGLGDTFFGAGGELHYYSVATFDVNMGAGGNTVNIQQTNAASVTTFHTGAGNDTVTVCSTAPALGGDLAGIAGPLTVDVGGGNGDLLVVSDRKTALGNQAVVVAGNLISGFAGPSDDVPISYAGVPQLILHGSNTSALAETFHINDPMAPVTLLANDGKDTVNVHASHLPVTIDAGQDNDTIVVGNLGNSLDTILGPVTVAGGPGIDALQINDQGAVTDKTYDVTPISATRSGAGAITFNSSIDSLVLKTGSGNDQVNVLGLPNVQLVAVTDTSGDDRLTGPSQLNTWQVLATNAGKLDDRVHFFGIENLTGGAAKDTFPISSGAGLSGKIDGGGGLNDSLDYQLWNQPVSFDLANLKATGLGAFAGIERFGGGSASDTLTGPNAPNFWSVKAANAGEINTLFFGVLAFSSVENLHGGTSSDVFQFTTAGQLAGSVNGDNGTDTLDYSQFPITMPVQVNLLASTATRVVGSVAAIENVAGSAGDDILVGNSLANTLNGNGGRDLIIGGLGSDILSGGAGDDLLIGGNTFYDLNVSALTAIMAEWTSSSAYDLRRKHLLGQVSGGLNGVYTLNNVVVPDDGDQLTGGADMDWFWANTNEIMEILQPGEKIGIN